MSVQNEQNQYDFITNSNQSAKKSWLPKPNSKKQRIIFVTGAGIGLLLLVFVGFALISSIGKGDTKQLMIVAQQHAELVRVAEIGTQKADGADARNLAITTKLALQSSQNDLLEAIGKTKKISDKDLAAGQNSDTDKALESADQSNRFDEEFTKILHAQLTTYRQELGKAFEATSSQSTREVYGGIYKQLDLLVPAKK